MPTLLDGEEARNIYIKRSMPPRKYGKRLEFKPPMTQKLNRKFPNVDTNLDKSKSQSASELPGLKTVTKERKPVTKSLTNARRLYRIVKPLAPARFPSDEDRERCIGPEFVVRSGQPIVQLDLATGGSLSETTGRPLL